MNTEDRDRDLLAYANECIAQIDLYTAGGTVQPSYRSVGEDATLWRLETLCDACAQLSDELQVRHPEIDWPGIRGLRNVLAHGYQALVRQRWWAIVRDDLALWAG